MDFLLNSKKMLSNKLILVLFKIIKKYYISAHIFSFIKVMKKSKNLLIIGNSSLLKPI